MAKSWWPPTRKRQERDEAIAAGYAVALAAFAVAAAAVAARSERDERLSGAHPDSRAAWKAVRS